MDISLFDYALPVEAIAQEPAAERDASRLLGLDRGRAELAHHTFRELDGLLQPGDLLVVNRSRVFPARLRARRATGGAVEVLLVEAGPDHEWEALLRPAARLREGERLEVEGGQGALTVVVASGGEVAPDGRRRVRLESTGDSTAALLEKLGHVPLPPYVRRADTPADRERYQTVYAKEPGSVAAPTAGLHFSPELLARLEARGVRRAEVLLHVGPGTFRPVSVADVREHHVAAEPFSVPAETAQAIDETRSRGGRVIAVGTTSVRVLESVATTDGRVEPRTGRTDLVILPGHSFQVVDALITNFHLPRSSLLLLVSAFAGRERVLDAYRAALELGYRFYSYGDAMLIE